MSDAYCWIMLCCANLYIRYTGHLPVVHSLNKRMAGKAVSLCPRVSCDPTMELSVVQV